MGRVGSGADLGAAAGAEARAARELGTAFGAVLDGRREPLAAAHAELGPGRVGGLAGGAHRPGGLLGRGALRLAPARPALGGRYPGRRRTWTATLAVGHAVLGRGLLGLACACWAWACWAPNALASPKPAPRNAPSTPAPPWAMPWPAPSAISPAA